MATKTTEAPTILLVPGNFHGPWIFRDLIPALKSQGFPSTESVNLATVSGDTTATQFTDAAAIRDVILSLINAGKRVIVLAHSYGTQVALSGVIGLSQSELPGSRSNGKGYIMGFISLCGMVFPGGMDQGAVIAQQGGLDYISWDDPSPGLFVAKDPQSLFYEPDCTPAQASWGIPQLKPSSSAANRGVVPPQAWQDEKFKAGFGYVHTTLDPVLPYEFQLEMVKGSGGGERWVERTLEGSGHSPMVSRPGDVARAVREIVDEWGSKNKAGQGATGSKEGGQEGGILVDDIVKLARG
jgi:pimeloyl-ACP methyl ester carboxylesterase